MTREERLEAQKAERRRINKAKQARRKTDAIKQALSAEREAPRGMDALEREIASRTLARKRLLPYVLRFEEGYMPGWVHRDICARLEKFYEDVKAGKSPRLILAMPPRTGKSTLGTVNFPSWVLGQDPSMELITAAYAADLAQAFSKKVRERLNDPDYQVLFPETQIKADDRSAAHWTTTRKGAFVAAGVGGGITGKGAHCAHFSVAAPTKRGVRCLADVQVGDEVLGYDHEAGRVRWARVRAVSTQRKPELVEVNGALLTPDHLVYTEERGYVRADSVEGGELKVLSLWRDVRTVEERTREEPAAVRAGYEDVLLGRLRQPAVESHGVPGVRWEEGAPRGDLRSVLPGGQAGRAAVRALRGLVHTRIERAREKLAQTRRGLERVLRQRLLRGVPGVEASADTAVGRTLPDVRGRCSSGAEVLQPAVLPRTQLSEGGVLRQVEQAEARGCVARRAHVRALRQGEGPDGDPPHRSRRVESRAGEPDPALRAVPQPLSSSQLGRSARDLAGALPGEGHWVVDIQTDTGNFFADGVLVHNCLIIDDPVKNAEEAESEAQREAVWDWYTSTAYTRLAPGGGVLVIMTRWHDMDLAGRLEHLSDLGEGDKFEVVRYPAIALEDERFRKKGEALHPERYDEKALARIEKAVGPRVWSALYQQRPSPEEGSYFTTQMITYYDAGEAPTDLTLYAAWDFAITKSDRSDYTVGLLVGVDRAENIWVLDVVRRRMDSMEIVEAMLDMWEEYDIKLMGAEEGHIKHAIGPFLEARVEERKLYDFGVEPLKPGRRDKEMRARSIQGRMAQGRVLFPRDADWTPQVVSELLAFPFGQHDDVVDAFGWIGLMLQEMDHIPDRPNTNGPRRRVPFQTSLASRLKRLGKTARKRDWRVA